jgi:hypothetical protein
MQWLAFTNRAGANRPKALQPMRDHAKPKAGVSKPEAVKNDPDDPTNPKCANGI